MTSRWAEVSGRCVRDSEVGGGVGCEKNVYRADEVMCTRMRVRGADKVEVEMESRSNRIEVEAEVD
ncbi:hypothetical protein PMAC_002789 [Pneumocystis sp. 'macacae']|nr:hypothetical protein PMAC_002789 [Pneumocystis sp. 'macacae']